MASAPRIPGCSYRVQLNKSFNFRDATALVDYLDALGVTDLYASPVLAARPGSTHGYDVVDHDRLNPDLGTESDLDALAAALRARGMGLILDLVPNHMCIASSDNRWWNDVLENGRSSPFSPFFDIDWHPPKSELREKVLLPVLGEQYGRVLENQQITIRYEAGAFFACYGDARYPLDPRTILPLLEPMAADLRRNHPDDHPDLLEIESIVTATKHLPKRWETDPTQVRERQREKEIGKRRLDALVSGSAAARDALERSLAAINGEKGKPQSFDRLEALLGDQTYRMSFWGVAAEEINYRRFFDINDLAAIRVEEPVVMGAVHAKAFQLLHEGKVTGLRIDHVDGLLEPQRYLENLQHEARGEIPVSLLEASDGPSDGRSTYVVVEKILTGDETLPAEWPVHGTTGYEFLNVLNGLFVDPAGARAIERAYERLRDGTGSFDDLVYRAKKLILRTALSSELYVLASRLDRISEQHRWSRDFTASNLHLALGETIACFPVYRSYVQGDTSEVSSGDRQHVMRAIRDAKRRNRSTNESVFDFIADVLLLRDPEGLSDAERAERREFVLRLQQLTGPVMAKGLEDTVFYRYFPLASLDEVGGRPTAGGVDLERFHAWNLARAERWPQGLSTTATHDTKRGEDMRVRLDVLSEIPREWRQAVRRWQRLNRRLKSRVDDIRVPETNEEYFIYQTLVGVWPMQIDAELSDAAREELPGRIGAYMTKAVREAKQHTSWINVNAPYERGVDQFVRRLLSPTTGAPFLADLKRFLAGVVRAGAWNGLVQVGLKATLPGVPDFYQGNELWDLSLVDPDNRRPVDYEHRRALLGRLEALDEDALPAFARDALLRLDDGALKMLVMMRALRHRRRNVAIFAAGGYLPLVAEGERARHVVAFARLAPGAASITVAGRFFAALAGGDPSRAPGVWNDTRLPLPPELTAERYRDVLSGVRIAASADGAGKRWLPVADLFATLPIVILEPG
jgi:(1->4)-alpha-D-glucan 1-alpha-D-glucosylmutase